MKNKLTQCLVKYLLVESICIEGQSNHIIINVGHALHVVCLHVPVCACLHVCVSLRVCMCARVVDL